MRIGIEANALKNAAGTGVLARHLIDDLRHRGHDVVEFAHDFSSTGRSRPSSSRRWLNGVRQVFWTQVTLPLAAARQRVDVLLCPAYVGPLWSPAPLVLMVLDLTFLLEPQTGDRLYMGYLRRLVPALVRRARRVVTISHSAATEIARLLPAAAGKLEVAYPGPGEIDVTSQRDASNARIALQRGSRGPAGPDPPPTQGLPAKYILMVGTLEPRKNYLRAIQAFARFQSQGFSDWHLVIAGGKGWGSEQVDALVGQLGLSQTVTLMGRVTPPVLATLYRQAGALFYPSLYEGFGFPILEAMVAGCPVVTSNRSSMVEVGDAAVELVDPSAVDAMASGLMVVAGDQARRAELIERGRARAAEFSWERFGAAVERTLTAATTPNRD